MEAQKYVTRNALSTAHVNSLEQALGSSKAEGAILWCFSETPEYLIVLTDKGELVRFMGTYNRKVLPLDGDILFGTAPDGTTRAIEIGFSRYLGLHPSRNAADLARKLGARKSRQLDDICSAWAENSRWMVEESGDSAPTQLNVAENEEATPVTVPASPSVHITSVEAERTMAEQDVSRLEERLRTLIDLHNKGLIADEDLARRREEILREI